MANTSPARSLEEAPKYGGLYLVKAEAESAAMRVGRRREVKVYLKPGSADLVPMACGALAMPLLWALDKVLHSFHF